MSEKHEIEPAIKAILVKDLNVEPSAGEISADSSIRDELGVDSLGFEELRVRCEEQFGIRIGDEEFTSESFGTVRSLAALVVRLRHADGGEQQ